MLWQLVHLDLCCALPTLMTAQSPPQFTDRRLRPDHPADKLTSWLALMAALACNPDQVSPVHELTQSGVRGDCKALGGRHGQILAPQDAYCMPTELTGSAGCAHTVF